MSLNMETDFHYMILTYLEMIQLLALKNYGAWLNFMDLTIYQESLQQDLMLNTTHL